MYGRPRENYFRLIIATHDIFAEKLHFSQAEYFSDILRFVYVQTSTLENE